MSLKSVEERINQIERSMDNMQKNQKSISIGGFFLNILTLIFVVAKLTGHFNYSWWVVFSPWWIPWVLLFTILLGLVVFIGAVKLAIFLFIKQ